MALLVLGAAFLTGGILGCIMALQFGKGENVLLVQYIQQCLQATEGSNPSLLLLVWETVRFPGLTVALGFTAAGLIGIPLLFLVRGFLLAFSVSGFVGLFGGAGGWLAFLLLGTGGVLAIPPLFVLGTQGIAASRKLFRRGLGGRREGEIYSKQYFVRCGLCALFLFICVLLDYCVIPRLLRTLINL